MTYNSLGISHEASSRNVNLTGFKNSSWIENPPWISGIVAAAGRGTRMGGALSKQRLELRGKAVLAHTLEKLCASGILSECIVVVPQGEIEIYKNLSAGIDTSCGCILRFTEGGADRNASVRLGLEALNEACTCVLIHDGARPFVPVECIVSVVKKALETGAAVVAVPVKDTIKIVGPEGVIESTPDRSRLYHIQTPQVFRRDWIEEAHKAALAQGWESTDDSGLVERLGYSVHIVPGSYYNLKLTTPEDLVLANNLLEAVMKPSADTL
ncbi:MAG: 2-C-methyl-D-erythritol 4-phosphate cytidylyltransferase [Erysipelotrichaceae bacterium]|nr:2-C-methyl-D-erythritol 4-phosphate cytidylyltransferase [Erysipelotrichaceae bacterium]